MCSYDSPLNCTAQAPTILDLQTNGHAAIVDSKGFAFGEDVVGKPGLIGNNIGDTVTIALPTIGDGLMYIGVLHSYVTQLHTRVYPGKTQCRNTHIRTHTLPPTSFVHARTHANALTRMHHAPHTTHYGVVSYDRVGCMSAVLVVPSTSTIQCTGGIPTEEPEVSFVPAHLTNDWLRGRIVRVPATHARR